MDTYFTYFFQALRRNYQWHRERVAQVYRCRTEEELVTSLADAYSREWHVETVYGPGGQPVSRKQTAELVREARMVGLRLQEERSRLRRSLR